jgi:hypothetical protein
VHTKRTGEVSELQVLAALARDGHVLAIPFGDNQRYDLLIDRGGVFERVQVKTGRLRTGAVRFQTCSTGSTTDHRTSVSYKDQVEWFGVYCPENGRCYLVPIGDLPGVEGSLRVEASRNGQTTGVRWASNYEIGNTASA